MSNDIQLTFEIKNTTHYKNRHKKDTNKMDIRSKNMLALVYAMRRMVHNGSYALRITTPDQLKSFYLALSTLGYPCRYPSIGYDADMKAITGKVVINRVGEVYTLNITYVNVGENVRGNYVHQLRKADVVKVIATQLFPVATQYLKSCIITLGHL